MQEDILIQEDSSHMQTPTEDFDGKRDRWNKQVRTSLFYFIYLFLWKLAKP